MQGKSYSAVVSYWLLAAALVRIGLDCLRHLIGEMPQGGLHEVTYYAGGVICVLLAILARRKPRLAAVSGLLCYALLFTYFMFTAGEYAGLWIWFELFNVAALAFALGFAVRRSDLPLGPPATTGGKWLHLGAGFFGAFACLPLPVVVLLNGIELLLSNHLPKSVQLVLAVLSICICTAAFLIFPVRRKLAWAGAGIMLAASIWMAVVLLFI